MFQLLKRDLLLYWAITQEFHKRRLNFVGHYHFYDSDAHQYPPQKHHHLSWKARHRKRLRKEEPFHHRFQWLLSKEWLWIEERRDNAESKEQSVSFWRDEESSFLKTHDEICKPWCLRDHKRCNQAINRVYQPGEWSKDKAKGSRLWLSLARKTDLQSDIPKRISMQVNWKNVQNKEHLWEICKEQD